MENHHFFNRKIFFSPYYPCFPHPEMENFTPFQTACPNPVTGASQNLFAKLIDIHIIGVCAVTR